MSPEPAFSVSLIPTTLELTTLGRKAPGDLVNLEVDVIAKYVERQARRTDRQSCRAAVGVPLSDKEATA